MTPEQMIELLRKYGNENVSVPSLETHQNIISFEHLTNKEINYAQELSRDKNNKIFYQRVNISDFIRSIECKGKTQFNFSEGFFVKKNSTTFEKIPLRCKYKIPYENLMVCYIDSQVGHGLFCVGNGLVKNERLYYSGALYRAGLKKEKREYSLACACDHYAAVFDKVDEYFYLYSSMYLGGIARFVQSAPTEDQIQFYSFYGDYNPADVATANVSLEFDKYHLGMPYYQAICNIPEGQEILGDWVKYIGLNFLLILDLNLNCSINLEE